MARKRNFLAMAARSAENLDLVLRGREFAAGLLWLRYVITLPEGDPDFVAPEDLAPRVCELFDEEARAAIGEAVDRAYVQAEVDIDTDHARRYEELQFTNEHARTILRWSFACMAAAPIVTAYMDMRDIDARDGAGLLMDCFGRLLSGFEEPGTDILAKLHKLVHSRVMNTRYSDKVIWHFLRNVATDPDLYIDRLFRKFVVEGIPKLEQGTNIVRFFHAFLRLQIKYQFTGKIGMNFRPVRNDVMDEGGQSAMENLEAELIRRDEGAAVMADIAAERAIAMAELALEVPPTDEEVDHLAAVLLETGVNAWQRGMVTKFFLPAVGRVEMVKTRTLAEYARMVLIVREWLEENQFPCLADYMRARVVEGADSRRLMSRKKFVREFMDSAQYRELLGGLYGLAGQALIDSGVIIDMIGSLHVNAFERIVLLGEETPEEPERVDHRVEAVAQEVLRFITFVARPPE